MKSQGLARLGRDADLRYTPSGTPVANLALAFNYGRKDDQGNLPTQWVQAALWGKRAESLAPYLLKGTAIVAYMSETHVETFTKRDGSEGHALAARIDDIDLVPTGQSRGGSNDSSGSASDYANASRGGGTGRAQASGAPPAGSDDDLGDIPF